LLSFDAIKQQKPFGGRAPLGQAEGVPSAPSDPLARSFSGGRFAAGQGREGHIGHKMRGHGGKEGEKDGKGQQRGEAMEKGAIYQVFRGRGSLRL